MTEGRIGVLDVPDFALFVVTSVAELVAEYEHRFGNLPEAICLPVTSRGGFSYNSGLGVPNVAPNKKVEGSDKLLHYDLQRALIEASALGLQIYLSIDLTLPYVTTNSEYNLVDSSGDETPKCCIVNPNTMDVIKDIIDESRALADINGIAIHGYAINVQNLWPMSATKEHIELTCYCSYCQLAMRAAKPTLDLQLFLETPNPWNLALRDSGGGISHLNEITADDRESAILEKSRAGQFFQDKWFVGQLADDTVQRWANQLWLYAHARNIVTKNSIDAVLMALPSDVKKIIIAEKYQYDWTTGLFFSTILDFNVDEFWLPPGALPLPTGNRFIRSYMAARGRYHVDALFDYIHHIQRVAGLDASARSQQSSQQRLRFVEYSQRLLQSSYLSRMDARPILRSGRTYVAAMVTEQNIRDMMEALGLSVSTAVDSMGDLASLLSRLRGS